MKKKTIDAIIFALDFYFSLMAKFLIAILSILSLTFIMNQTQINYSFMFYPITIIFMGWMAIPVFKEVVLK